MRREADMTQGIEQCPYVTHHGKAAECVCTVNGVYERRLLKEYMSGSEIYARWKSLLEPDVGKPQLTVLYGNLSFDGRGYNSIVANNAKLEDAPNRSSSQLESAKVVVSDLDKTDQQALYEFMHGPLGCRIYER